MGGYFTLLPTPFTLKLARVPTIPVSVRVGIGMVSVRVGNGMVSVRVGDGMVSVRLWFSISWSKQ